MKGRRLLDVDPDSLDDADLDIQVGALTEEIEKIESELLGLDRVRSSLTQRLRVLVGRNDRAKVRRGQGQGRGNN